MTKAKCRRAMTKSPKRLAEMALRAASQALPEQSSKFSPKIYTQQQIFAILVLKAFFRTDYRGIQALLEDFSDLRQALKLKRVPHFSTLWYAEQKLLKKGALIYSNLPYFESQKEFAFFEDLSGASLTPQDWKHVTSVGTTLSAEGKSVI